MPRSGSFLPVYSGLGMDVKSVSHLYKESRSLDIVRALIRGDDTVQTTLQAKVQHEHGRENLPSLSVPPRLLGSFCHQRNLQLATLLLLNPPWLSMTLTHKIPSHLRVLYTHLLEILTFHYTRTQLWNQAHSRCRLSPFQHRLMLSQKCQPSG
jgi:hypothetical protein